MAELKKVQQYPYDLQEIELPEQPLPDSPSEKEIVLPQSPAKRLKQISIFEKLAVVCIAFSVIALCVLTVMLRTNISGMEKQIGALQVEYNEKNQEKISLEQEKSELSRTERVKKIAEEKGLSNNDDNLRKVK